MTKTHDTVTARLDNATADDLLLALANALHGHRGAGAADLALDTGTARNLLLALTHSLQAAGSKKKKNGKNGKK